MTHLSACPCLVWRHRSKASFDGGASLHPGEAEGGEVTRYVWARVGDGKRGHAFALAQNGAVRDPLHAVCGVGPGYDFDVDPSPHCKRCEKLVPISAGKPYPRLTAENEVGER